MKSDSRRAKLIEELRKGTSPAEASRRAGYSESYGRVNVYQMLASASFQRELAGLEKDSPANSSTNEISDQSIALAGEIANPDEIDELTVKQRLFKNAYLGEAKGNGVKAARIAGYGGDDRTLASIASENLTKPNIREAVDRGLAAKFGEIAHSATDEIAGRLRDPKQARKVQFQHLLKAAEVSVDKGQLLRGQPTSITADVERQELVIILQDSLRAGLDLPDLMPPIDVTPRTAQMDK